MRTGLAPAVGASLGSRRSSECGHASRSWGLRVSEGSFVYEPPGEIHTLVVDDVAGTPEMITQFNIHGAMVYVDEQGRQTGYEDVFTKIALCRAHYEAVGLGGGYIDQFVR